MPKYNVEVIIALTGPSGNALAVMGLASGAMKEAGASPEEIVEYTHDAMSSDYEHLLAVTRQWVDLVTV